MRSGGEFVDCDFHYREMPSRVASLLKFKKHEWIVVAFISSLLVRRLWWNKGPGRTQVRSFSLRLTADKDGDVIRELPSWPGKRRRDRKFAVLHDPISGVE